MRIAVDSAGAWEDRKVDLVETFNYLIGLTVRHIDIQLKQGFVTVEGTLPSGEKTLILWRDCEKIGYEALTKLCDKLAINPSDSEYDVVYVNGDHNIPSVVQPCSIVRTLTIEDLRPEFTLSGAFFSAPPPLAWFLPGPIRMRGGAARHFASDRHFHWGIHPEATWRKPVE